MTSWMLYNRSTRSHRPHRSRLNDDNCVKFNLSKDIKENLTEALIHVCKQHGVTGVRKLAYLNAIVKLVGENDVSEYGCNTNELFCCLRVGLVHEATQVRAATLRAIRYLLKKEQDVIAINKLQIPYFISRSMDVNIRNEIERIQALRIVRRILFLAPKHFSPVLARSLVSITNGGIEEKDQAFRVFLAVLSELGVLNPHLLISCGGVSVLCRVVTTGQSPGITEAVVGVLLRLLSHPELRNNVSLLCLAAPYCELESIGVDRSKEDWDQKFAASKYALLSVLRSFPGILHFCHPNENSGLKAITNILYVEQLEVRGAVLELFYELLGLPLPTWTDEPDVALAAVDPRRFRDSWKLSEGFVAAEGRTILPPVTSHCPNISEVHSALLVYILIESGLHRALAETIVTSDTFICVRAAVLLGALLHMAHSLLPPEICDLTPPLPTLLEHASIGRRQALAAVAILSRMHSLMRRRLLPISLFMDRLLQSGTWLKPSYARGPRSRHSSLRQWLKRQSPLTQLIKDSQVLNSKDALAWNWSAVRTTLRARNDVFRLMQDSDHRLFIKKLIRYFKPSTNQYSRVELATLTARETTLAGCDLINFCLDLEETECKRFLDELIGDIAEQIAAISTAKSAHDCLFSPKHVSTLCCQKYFLFVGQLSHSPRGACLLQGFKMLEKFQDLVINTKHDCYVKLIVSCLDYSKDGHNRKVLTYILKNSTLEITRLYIAQFLRILLRTKINDVHQWVVGLLLDKLNDDARSVALAALEALHEACEDPQYLEIILQKTEGKYLKNWDQWLENLGDLGHLLKIRLYSHPAAYTSLPSPAEELEKWIRPGGLAERYAGLVESEIHDSFTRRQRGENGCYMRRNSGNPIMQKDVFVPPHLVGQLVQHEMGLQLLLKRNVLQRFARIVHRFWNECGNTASQSKDTYLREDCRTEEKKNDMDFSRLETIMDSEVTERSEYHSPQTLEPYVEIRRKLSQDDSKRTTPEKHWRGDVDSHEESLFSIEGRILKVKSAIWALGHAGTSPLGVEQLIRLGILELITSIAENCSYYSVQAIAIYALSLVSTSRVGADALTVYGWSSLRYKRGDHWPVVQPGPTCSEHGSQSSSSPVSVQRHQRSLSDSKPEHARDSELVIKRQRNRSESAVTDVEVRKCMMTERAETPSPQSSVLRLSQQDAEGYAKLRSLQRHRIPSFSHSSLEMHSLDGRLSLQSLSEIETSRSWLGDSVMATTPPPSVSLLSPPPHSSQPTEPLHTPLASQTSQTSQPSTSSQTVEASVSPENHFDENPRYLGICLPKRLSMIFPVYTPTDVLLEKAKKSRSKYELRRNQNLSVSESSNINDDAKCTVQSPLRTEIYPNQSEIHLDNATAIPTIILEERSKASGDTIAISRLSESDSEVPSTCANNQLVPPENSRSKRKTSVSKQNASDIDEESSSEYDAASDHSRLCLVCYREKSVSKDSVGTDIDCRKPFDKIRKEILRHAQRLANPVFYKHSRQMLLTLRQQNPDIFQDVCIYSEVAARLANNTYRIQARRFLQELFFDSSFEALFDEPTSILKLPVDKSDDQKLSSNIPTDRQGLSEVVNVTSLLGSVEITETKVNGRVATASDQVQAASVIEENLVTSSSVTTIVSENLHPSNSSQISTYTSVPQDQRRSDEKIIAEILKPEERMRVPKNSEKILKATSINTAISLD